VFCGIAVGTQGLVGAGGACKDSQQQGCTELAQRVDTALGAIEARISAHRSAP
jgi:hypothetical protein